MNSTLQSASEIAMSQTNVKKVFTLKGPQTVSLEEKRIMIETMTPTKNTLGSLAGVSASHAVLAISDETILSRYNTAIMAALSAEQKGQLKAGFAELASIQQLIEAHSPVIQDRLVKELSDQYSLSPTPENFEKLRHAKTLSPADHGLVQQRQTQRRDRVIGGLSDVIKVICRTAAAEVQAEGDNLHRMEAALAEAWHQPHAPSALLRGISAKARALANDAAFTGAAGHVPEIVKLLAKTLT